MTATNAIGTSAQSSHEHDDEIAEIPYMVITIEIQYVVITISGKYPREQ